MTVQPLSERVLNMFLGKHYSRIQQNLLLLILNADKAGLENTIWFSRRILVWLQPSQKSNTSCKYFKKYATCKHLADRYR